MPVMKAPAAAVSTLTATAIVVADMIGVGVFTSLGFQVTDIKSGFTLLLLWLVGGVVALCGAFCYAELATMFPRSSGEYNFLNRMYGSAFGFMAGWLSATVGFAAPVALAGMAFGQYAKAVLPSAPPLLLGLAVIWIVTAVHLRSTRHGSVLQVGSTLFLGPNRKPAVTRRKACTNHQERASPTSGSALRERVLADMLAEPSATLAAIVARFFERPLYSRHVAFTTAYTAVYRPEAGRVD